MKEGAADAAAPAVTGSRPWVTIMCQFSDIAGQPEDRAYFVGMYADTQPGLDHYWREVSFNTANVAGSDVETGWYTINTLATYNPGLCQGCADLDALATDCIAAAGNRLCNGQLRRECSPGFH